MSLYDPANLCFSTPCELKSQTTTPYFFFCLQVKMVFSMRTSSSFVSYSILFFPMYVLCLVIQSCLTLCDPMECRPPGSSVYEILQARILELVAMPSSRGSSQPRDQTQVSCIAGGFFYCLSYQRSPSILL